MEDFEKKYNEALERAREIKSKILSSHLSTESCKAVSEYIDTIIPELSESNDERIRKAIEDIIRVYGKTQNEWIAGYDMDTLVIHLREAFSALEKQKGLFTEGPGHYFYDGDKVHFCSAPAMEMRELDDSNEPVEHWQYVGYVNLEEDKEKQKEQSLRDFIDDFPSKKPYWKPTETDVALFNKAVTTNKTLTPAERAQLDIIRTKFGYCRAVNCSGIVQKEQKPVEKQDYSGLNDLERAIHRGFLCAGIENVPVEIIKETEKECLEEMKPAEWKPSSESMEALVLAIEGDWNAIKPTGYMSRRLEDLYDGLVNTFDIDEKYLDNLPKTACTEKDIEEVKALKEKIGSSMEQKPVEWSEEDETALGDLMWCIEQAKKSAKDENDMGNIWFAENWLKNRLKSLRPSWKHSEEQTKGQEEPEYYQHFDPDC